MQFPVPSSSGAPVPVLPPVTSMDDAVNDTLAAAAQGFGAGTFLGVMKAKKRGIDIAGQPQAAAMYIAKYAMNYTFIAGVFVGTSAAVGILRQSLDETTTTTEQHQKTTQAPSSSTPSPYLHSSPPSSSSSPTTFYGLSARDVLKYNYGIGGFITGIAVPIYNAIDVGMFSGSTNTSNHTYAESALTSQKKKLYLPTGSAVKAFSRAIVSHSLTFGVFGLLYGVLLEQEQESKLFGSGGLNGSGGWSWR